MTSRWARWTPRSAALGSLVYAAVHAYWAVAGPPRFPGPGESFLPEGWAPVAASAVAAVVALLVTVGWDSRPVVRWSLAASGWVTGVALLLYSFMLPLSLLTVLGALFGAPVRRADLAVLLAQGSGATTGVLAVAVAVVAQRRARHACPACGRIHGRSPERRTDPSPWWAYLGGYGAVAACLLRLGAQLPDGFRMSLSPGTTRAFVLTFLVLMVLAGTVLPLALAHRWGRIWPGWVLPLAGRPVPRWLVLGPALFVGAGLTGYFGVGGTTAWATGRIPGASGWFLPVTLAAYTVWGLGLLVAAASYLALTRPVCPTRATGGDEPEPSHPTGMMAG
ncbi:hypothetical protein MRQ36_02605 [Micromonospora sp. R77]|uniref:hypothetical protein n=1 Tax=Micromonospora sp. R77 TaxID=2925836 RepID=UPI001F60D140|nr:hypothetical protein [Micromonospora sp. R77]MCI4061523.1 hypothetical protein [Micromonospora sp. R77]